MPGAKEGGARPRYAPGGGVGAPKHFALEFIAKVAGNPFSRARDNERELKRIQAEKYVNARTTHSWSQEVSLKLCMVPFAGKGMIMILLQVFGEIFFLDVLLNASIPAGH